MSQAGGGVKQKAMLASTAKEALLEKSALQWQTEGEKTNTFLPSQFESWWLQGPTDNCYALMKQFNHITPHANKNFVETLVDRFAPDEEKLVLSKPIVQFSFSYDVSRDIFFFIIIY